MRASRLLANVLHFTCVLLGRASAAAKLYHFPLFSSSRVVQLLLELDLIPNIVELVVLDYKQINAEPYLSINPHGTVPAYQEEESGLILLESAAIITYLCEKHDQAHRLLPREPVARARYFQFSHYAPATLYSRAGGLYVHSWEFRDDAAGAARRDPDVIEENRLWLRRNFVPFLSRELNGRKYLLGDELSAADIIIGWELMLLGKEGFLNAYPLLKEYLSRLASHDSWRLTYPDAIHDYCIWPHEDKRCASLHRELKGKRSEL